MQSLLRFTLVLGTAAMLAGCQALSLTRAPEGLAVGLASGELGQPLGMNDRNKALRAEYRALEFGTTGAPVNWHGGRERRGNVIPGPAYQVNETDCRDYTHTIVIGDEANVARGTACRQSDGVWKLNG